MIKSLLATCLLASSVGAPTLEPRYAQTNEVIEYQYETNEVVVVAGEYRNLVVGNIYQINFYYYEFDSAITSDTGYNSEIVLYIPDNVKTYSKTGNTLTFDYMGASIYDFNVNLFSLEIGYDDNEENEGVLIFNFDKSMYGDYDYICSLPFVYNGGEFGYAETYPITACELKYIPYQVVTTRPSNLYTIVYDFYSSLFVNNELGAMTTTIGGQSLTFNNWIAHTLTIITFITGLVLLFFVLRWIFRQFAGLVARV